MRTSGSRTRTEASTIERMRRRLVPVLHGILFAGSLLFLTAVIVGAAAKQHDLGSREVPGARGRLLSV
jgi:hypothetical protein